MYFDPPPLDDTGDRCFVHVEQSGDLVVIISVVRHVKDFVYCLLIRPFASCHLSASFLRPFLLRGPLSRS